MVNTLDKLTIAQSISPFWSLMTDEERDLFVESIDIVQYPKGHIVFEEGDLAMNVMYMVEGKVKLQIKGPDDKLHIISVAGDGESFALQAPFTTGLHNTTAEITTDATIVKIPHKLLLKLVDENKEISRYIINKIAANLDAVILHMLSIQQKHLRGRLAESLLYLVKKFGFEEDGKTINARPTRKDLAARSHMDTSNAIRTLSAFASEEIVELDGRRISILDIDKLRWISAKE